MQEQHLDSTSSFRLLHPSELRCKRDSRYFRPRRTQPFIITFISAIVAFKRLAKQLKSKSVEVRLQQFLFNEKKTYLELEIAKANTTRHEARFGASAITMTNIKPKVDAQIVYRDADTGYVFKDKESAHNAEQRLFAALRRPFIPKKKKLKKVCIHLYQPITKHPGTLVAP